MQELVVRATSAPDSMQRGPSMMKKVSSLVKMNLCCPRRYGSPPRRDNTAADGSAAILGATLVMILQRLAGKTGAGDEARPFFRLLSTFEAHRKSANEGCRARRS